MEEKRAVTKLFDAICVAWDTPAYYPVFENGVLKETFSNRFVNDVAQSMGCHDFVDLMTKSVLNADDIIRAMSTSDQWLEIRITGDAEGIKIAFHSVQMWANQGYLTIAGATSVSLSANHGHVCVVRPGLMKSSGKWGDVPVVANCGKENFIGRAKSGPMRGEPVGVNESFIAMPRFWCWRGLQT